jgi:hypothetical protein
MFGAGQRIHAMPNRCRALTVMLAVTLSACSTDYRPQGPGDYVGYSDMRLAPDRYRVSFTGSGSSTWNDVEAYLQLHAAEVTLRAGYSHFTFNTYRVVRNTRYSYYPGGPPIYYYPPSNNWLGNIWPVTTFSAEEEIQLWGPEKATGYPGATDAAALLQGKSAMAPLQITAGNTK